MALYIRDELHSLIDNGAELSPSYRASLKKKEEQISREFRECLKILGKAPERAAPAESPSEPEVANQ